MTEGNQRHKSSKLLKIYMCEQIWSKGSNMKMTTENLKINYKTQK